MTPRAVVIEAFPIHKSIMTLYRLYEWHVNKGAFVNMREIFFAKSYQKCTKDELHIVIGNAVEKEERRCGC